MTATKTLTVHRWDKAEVLPTSHASGTAACHRAASSHARSAEMLRDIAFVLHCTRQVRSMMESSAEPVGAGR